MFSPIASAENLEIEDWNNNEHPKLFGKPLDLSNTHTSQETSRSLAITPDNQNFLLGTESYLWLFDRTGKEKWHVWVPGVAWQVNISGNGMIAVAGLGDGTIRWFRISDGKELLALFPHSDKKRWIIWTPEGYYDASTGAEDLIGWHININENSAAKFFSIGSFKSKYYRPDVIARVLKTLNVKEAVHLADKEKRGVKKEIAFSNMLPPEVRIISPRDDFVASKKELHLKYIVSSTQDEPVVEIKVMVDGRPFKTEKKFKVVRNQIERDMIVTIPERDCNVSIVARNRYSMSEPVIAKIIWKGRHTEYAAKPNLYILSIGVTNYVNTALRNGVRFSAKDAKDFVSVMKNQKGGLYNDIFCKEILDMNATKEGILEGLEWLDINTTNNDVAMIFLAGHGVNDRNGIYYFLPLNGNKEKLKSTGVSSSEFINTITQMGGKVIFFVDTCHSGNIMGPRRDMEGIDAFVNELSSAENGIIVFASSTGGQYSHEVDENGAFTKALLEGINGKAAKGNKITVKSLDDYIGERVKNLTAGEQRPITVLPTTIYPDFPMALIKH